MHHADRATYVAQVASAPVENFSFPETATYYSPSVLFSGQIYDNTHFISAVLNPGSGVDFIISFGLDTSLTVTKGWDNVTGYGSPNGLTFLNAVTK
jgi:hypothetical protein